MLRFRFFVALSAALVLAACGKAGNPGDSAAKPEDKAASGAAAAASAPVLLLSAEDLRTVTLGGAGGGPVITGSIQPEKRADLRAEVSAVATQV